MVYAALAAGRRADVAFDAPSDAVQVDLTSARPVRSPLYEVIARRQCTRADYDSRAVSPADIVHQPRDFETRKRAFGLIVASQILAMPRGITVAAPCARTNSITFVMFRNLCADVLALLERAGSGDGVRVMLFTGKPQLERILGYVTLANSAQLNDAAFVAELKAWIRFSAGDAAAAGDGLYAAASGNPALPRWLGAPLMSLLFTAGRENDKYARQVRSSPGIAVLVSVASDKANWVEAGRCYERFALQATALSLRNAMLNQPVEVTALRPQFASWLGVGAGRPDLVVRFGHGPETPRPLRRPVDAVLA